LLGFAYLINGVVFDKVEASRVNYVHDQIYGIFGTVTKKSVVADESQLSPWETPADIDLSMFRVKCKEKYYF